MLFRFLFWLMTLRVNFKLKRKMAKNKELAELISKEGFSVQIETDCKKVSRYFELTGAGFSSNNGVLPESTIQIRLADAKSLWRIMRELRRDKSQIFNYIQNKELFFEGDFSVLQRMFTIKEMLDAA